MGGKLTFPGGGIYHATTDAVEAISDAMRFEVGGFGVDVVLIEPGLIKTEFATAAVSALHSGTTDDGPYGEFNQAVAAGTAGAYEGPTAKLGGGPVLFRGPNINPRVHDLLMKAAQAGDVAVQVRGAPRPTGTDANTMQLSRGGVAGDVVGIPNRYMHSPVEVVSLDDLDGAARVLAEFCQSVRPEMDWIP